jgi:hypothetical protein
MSMRSRDRMDMKSWKYEPINLSCLDFILLLKKKISQVIFLLAKFVSKMITGLVSQKYQPSLPLSPWLTQHKQKWSFLCWDDQGGLSKDHRHLSNIDCIMMYTTCLVCFISTVNGRSKKDKKEAYLDWR